ncbi:MAG TPA: hypothetical protein VLH60_04515, partial [Sedimentisphaerales bacterium]|nr:hypothetical protein [Sedimentisphaerales bacterium]
MPLTRTQKRRHCTNAAFFLLMAAFLSASGCGLIEQKEPDLPYTALPDPATLPPATGGHVLSVKGEAITVAEIVDAVRTM